MTLARDLAAPALPKAGVSSRIQMAFESEEIEGLRLATRGRMVALGAVALLLPAISTYPNFLYFEGLLLVFLGLGWAQYALATSRHARRWHPYLFVTLDAGLLAFTLTVPSPFAENALTSQMALRGNVFIYYFMLLGVIAFSYRWRLMVWCGVVGALSWTLASLRTATLDDTTVYGLNLGGSDAVLTAITNPSAFFLADRLQEIVVLFVVAWMLGLVILRSRRLAERQITAERERANLARYFSPNIVDEIAKRDRPFAAVREQPAAVLFCDIVGFTKMAESQTPTETIDILRGYHQRIERAVFDHDGTLDKFLGDGVMATFGTPETGPHDAFDALACARDIVRAMEDWNRVLQHDGAQPIRISIGLHYGPVVIGDLGSARRLELAVLGDTVNVASRLESRTRDLDCRIVMSDHLLHAARASQRSDGAHIFDALDQKEPLALRGRAEPIPVWTS
ncbi:MAG: adenylate/guanylate cyclase domain-containing protein [Hyphomicrobiales bacterium]|nr:adenylate/guanylate cyclase domain-containing protein [Hyphomicrobiales bacterium]